MLGEAADHCVCAGTILVLISGRAQHDVQVIGGVKVEHDAVSERLFISQPLTLNKGVVVVTLFVGVTEGRSHTKVAGDRALDEAGRRRLTLCTVINLDTALELVTRPTGDDVDCTRVGVSTKQCRLRPLDHLDSLHLSNRQAMQSGRNDQAIYEHRTRPLEWAGSVEGDAPESRHQNCSPVLVVHGFDKQAGSRLLHIHDIFKRARLNIRCANRCDRNRGL